MILPVQTAYSVQNVCKSIKENYGLVAVHNYCNKAGLSNSYCKDCDLTTPTIETSKKETCAICGNNKKYTTTFIKQTQKLLF